MRIAVTGASGFIGRHVLTELLLGGAEVVAITRAAARLAGLGQVVRVIEMDITDTRPNSFDRLHRPDLLIHLAWDGLPNYQSARHTETELPHQYDFLSRIIEGGLPALFVAGTCLEYGRQPGELREDMPTRPNSQYGRAKDTLRQQLEALRERHPFDLTWARLFYMYGEGQSVTSLYSQLQTAVTRGERAFRMSGGEQLRDYLPVTEVARRIVALATLGGGQGIVNLCSGQPVSVRALVERWLNENSWNIELELGYYPYLPHEPMAYWGNPRKLNSLLANQRRDGDPEPVGLLSPHST